MTSKPLKALLFRKVDNKMEIYGPKTASQVAGWNDVDLVLLLCDFNEMKKPEHNADLRLFEDCTSGSKVAESAWKRIKQVRPISYMIGSMFLEEVKNFECDGYVFKE